jgi:hypothetical protein
MLRRVGPSASHLCLVLCDLCPSWAKCLASGHLPSLGQACCDLCPSWAKCLASGQIALRLVPELGQVSCALIEERKFPLEELPCDLCRSSAKCLAARLLFGFAWESHVAT